MANSTFLKVWESIQGSALAGAIDRIENSTAENVIDALTKIPASSDRFLSLLSTSADGEISQIEKGAKELTAQRFGHTVNLYIPLYLSNVCINSCLYCHFGKGQPKKEKTLSLEELKNEAEKILEGGYKNILLVAGESKKEVPLSFIVNSIKLLKSMGFAFVGIETQVFDVEEYKRLGAAGLDGVTIYQETYDKDIYDQVHLSGPKKNFEWRLSAPERVARAGIRFLGIGFLLGLGDWRREAVNLISHVKFLQKEFWQTSVSISFPRIHEAPENFDSLRSPSDNEFIRLILATRLACPDSLLTLSTRETAELRDRLFGVGINQVSAGSKTSPGAYSTLEDGNRADEQFPVVDTRSASDIVKALKKKGLDQVWKDWDITLKPVGS